MSRLLPALVLASVIGASLYPATALALSVKELATQLRTSGDYRVRKQAALALGASGQEAAVTPLCDALSDTNASVNVAAAAALGKQGQPSGLPWLKSALAKEELPSVRSQEEKSILALEKALSSGSVPDPPPPPSADAKYYVAIQVTNKTGRPNAEVDSVVRAAMQGKLLAKKGFAVAPKNETTAQAGQIIKSKSLKGYLLIATVEAPVYAGGDLSQVVRVSMWTYPDKSLQGEFTPKLTQSQTAKGDVQSESLLMKICAENAIESFQKAATAM